MESGMEIEHGTEDEVIKHVVNLRVIGMMCQKNCGKTVKNALDALPGAISAEATFRTSHAAVTVDLEKYFQAVGRKREEEDELSTLRLNRNDEKSLNKVKFQLESDATEAIEDIGFDVSVLGINDSLELIKDDILNVTNERDSALEQESLAMSALDAPTSRRNSSSNSVFSIDGDDQFSDNEDIIGSATFEIGGMSCAVCTGQVEKALRSVDGVKNAVVNLSTSRAKAQFKHSDMEDILPEPSEMKSLTDRDKLSHAVNRAVDAVRKVGYDCVLIEVLSKDEKPSKSGITLAENAERMEKMRIAELEVWKRLLIISSILTTPLLILHFTTAHSAHRMMFGRPDWKEWLSFYLATPVQFGVGRRFYISAYKSYTNGRVMGMDFLVSLGTTAAYLYSIIVFAIRNFSPPDPALDQSGKAHHLMPTFETGAMLITFVTLGKYLESFARGKTASALQKLMGLQPVIANLATVPHDLLTVDDNVMGGVKLEDRVSLSQLETMEVDINDVKIGDFLLVLPGARIPTDAVLVGQGGGGDRSYVDEAALSGEPFPVPKAIGDTLYGSTVNQLSVLLIRVTATGGDTILSRIVRLVEEAQVNKAPIQAKADKIASIFAPCVMTLSAITFFGWIIFNSDVVAEERFFMALMSAISVIVVACPCALGLATPTAVMVGTGVGATNGLLIKGGAVLEEAHNVDTVILDKTGTITTGRAVLGERMEFLDHASSDDPLLHGLPDQLNKKDIALWFAACVEVTSEHPIARAVVNAAKGLYGNDITFSKDEISVTAFAVFPGSGVEGLVSRKGFDSWRVRVGKRDFVTESSGDLINIPINGLSSSQNSEIGDREAEHLRNRGHIAIYVSVARENENGDRSTVRRVIGVLGVIDSVAPNASSTVSALESMGIDVWMCTGDHELTALAVAREVGIKDSNICAGVKPEGKADLVSRLQKKRRANVHNNRRFEISKQRGRVAFVGDGINDAIALARSDVGIAIGAGTEVAVEAADIVLVRSSLHDVVVALHLSRHVFNRIRVNFVWATGYNILALPFAAGAFYAWTDWKIPPAWAGLMMASSSVSVVTSSLLLKLYSKPIISDNGIQETSIFMILVNKILAVMDFIITLIPTRQRKSALSKEKYSTEPFSDTFYRPQSSHELA